jgi:predicted RNase H-related nuclease YkuK (DUF458 family)
VDYRKKIDMDEVRAFIESQSAETKIYVGGDSERHKIRGVWYADYTVCVVVHVDGCHGCRVFGEVVRERDFDQKKNKPHMRLMTEVYKIAELFLKIQDAVGDRECQVHLDINSKKNTVSNEVMEQATGYIRGTCNVVPMIKPDSPAASFCADRFAEIKQRRGLAESGAKSHTLSASRLKRKRKAIG